MAELYHFYMGTEHWRYTSGQADITVNGNIYEAQPVGRTEISFEYENHGASITMPVDLQPAPLYVPFNPSTVIWVEIAKSDGTKIFIGKVVSCSFDIDKMIATLKAISIQSIMKSKIPIRTYGTGCPFEVFDEDCALSGATWALSLLTVDVVISADLMKLTHPSFGLHADGYFNEGYVTLSFENSYIISHIGNTITLLFPLLLWGPGQLLLVYPGCDKTTDICKNRYNNEANYGGFPYIPQQNVVTDGF